MAEREHIIVESGDKEQPFHYAVGMYGSKFFKELKERRVFLGTRCPKCRKVYIHPRRVCGECFVEMKDFVEVGPKGRIGTFTILRYASSIPRQVSRSPFPTGTATSSSMARTRCSSTTSA